MFRLLALFAVQLALFAEGTVNCTPYQDYCVDSLTSNQPPKNCLDLKCLGYTSNGVYAVYPKGLPHYSFNVYCDQTSDSGGWTVFQRRMDGSVDFYRNWQNYKLGFGEVNAEHWLGNDKIAELIALYDNHELRVDMEATDNELRYAKYSTFNVGAEATKYRLTVGGYSGTAGDSLSGQSSQRFTTKDHDYDTYHSNCAVSFHGAWWYSACHGSNLNGAYLNGNHSTYANGVNWRQFRGYHESLKTTEMKFRPNVS